MKATDFVVVLRDVVDQVGFGFVQMVFGALWDHWGPVSIPLTRS